MANELKEIVDNLSFYGTGKWEVLKAERTESGLWNLTIKKMESIEIDLVTKEAAKDEK